jgi:hypothetical protein
MNKCYNIEKNSTRKEKSCFSKTPKETILLKSEIVKNLWKDPVYREKLMKNKALTLEKKGFKNYSLEELPAKSDIEILKRQKEIVESRKKIFQNDNSVMLEQKSDHHSAKHFSFIDPNGNVVIVFNLEKFCRENGLSGGWMSKVAKNSIPSYYGWRPFKKELIGVVYTSNRKHNQKTFKIKSPEGKIYEATNIKEFCIKHNLCKENLAAVIRGVRNNHKGWTRVEE